MLNQKHEQNKLNKVCKNYLCNLKFWNESKHWSKPINITQRVVQFLSKKSEESSCFSIEGYVHKESLNVQFRFFYFFFFFAWLFNLLLNPTFVQVVYDPKRPTFAEENCCHRAAHWLVIMDGATYGSIFYIYSAKPAYSFVTKS